MLQEANVGAKMALALRGDDDGPPGLVNGSQEMVSVVCRHGGAI